MNLITWLCITEETWEDTWDYRRKNYDSIVTNEKIKNETEISKRNYAKLRKKNMKEKHCTFDTIHRIIIRKQDRIDIFNGFIKHKIRLKPKFLRYSLVADWFLLIGRKIDMIYRSRFRCEYFGKLC